MFSGLLHRRTVINCEFLSNGRRDWRFYPALENYRCVYTLITQIFTFSTKKSAYAMLLLLKHWKLGYLRRYFGLCYEIVLLGEISGLHR